MQIIRFLSNREIEMEILIKHCIYYNFYSGRSSGSSGPTPRALCDSGRLLPGHPGHLHGCLPYMEEVRIVAYFLFES